MKTLNFSLAIILAFTLASCDKVKNPRIVKAVAVGSNFITKNNAAVSNTRKMMLEDYTGARCTACPAAAVTAKGLATTYGSKLVIIAAHVTFFAVPAGTYTLDLRSDAGDTWSADFGTTQLPIGMVNRKAYSPNPQSLSHTAWSSAAATAANDPLIVKLDVTTNYDTTVKALNTDIKATFNTTYTNNIKIVAVLLEDGIVGPQLDNGTIIPNYEFEHVLRGSINGDYGTDLKTAPIAANDTVRVSFNNFALNAIKYTLVKATPTSPAVLKDVVVDDKHISVVVFAFDALTKEVLQVEKVKIR